MGEEVKTDKIFKAAYNGQLKGLKKELQPNMLIEENETGKTVLQIAARLGHLDQIKDMLTKEMLTIKDNAYGSTPVHSTARYGHLDQIKDMLTPEMLTTKNNNGKTPLDLIEDPETRKEIEAYVNNNNKPKQKDDIKALHEKLDLILKKLDQNAAVKVKQQLQTKTKTKPKPADRTE